MKSHHRIPLLAAVLACASLGAAAAGASRPIAFTRLAVEDGLSQNTVLALFQDSEGFLWIGTEGGLDRYDGRSFIAYHHDSAVAGSLPGNYIWAVDEDLNGDLWIAIDGEGVARWQRHSDSFTQYRHDPQDAGTLASNNVRTLHVDAIGTVWIGTRDRGLDRLDPASGRVTHYRSAAAEASTLSHDEVFVITSDRAGHLWIGTNGGLNRLDPASGRFRRYRHDPLDPTSLADDRVRAIFEDRRGDLWVGTRGGLHQLVDRENGSFERYRHDPENPASLSDDQVRVIYEDVALQLWVGTAAGLNLLERDRRRFARYRHDPARLDSLPNDEIMSIWQDRGGVLWFGTKNGGLAKWNPGSWTFGHHTVDPSGARGLSHPVVTSFALDAAGRLWVGTMGGGLNVLDRGKDEWRHYRAGSGGLSDDRVMALLHDHSGLLWIGTASRGLDRLDPTSGRLRSFRSDPSDPRTLGADSVMSLAEDRDGNVWVGTFGGGASRFDRPAESFVRIAADSPLAQARVTCMAQDLTGALWLGTDGQGLYLLADSARVAARYVHDREDPAALGSDTVYALHVDASGTVWIGTRGGWLNRVEGSAQVPEAVRFRHYTARDGLRDGDIYGIQSDAQGNLWLATNRGLTRFHPRLGTARHYTRHHGLQANEFNFGAHYRSAGGELFFGGIDGFNAFLPARLAENTHAPPVVLRSLRVNNEPVAIAPLVYGAEPLELSYRDDVVAFEFAALDFAAPQENRYAYQLEGDAAWNDLGTDSRLTFTDLHAGHYLLKVKAANNDGLWSQEPLAIPFTVAPAPWATWWAYGAYLAVALLAAGSFVRSQKKKAQREAAYSRKLEAEVKARTRELNDRNAELAAANDKLREASLTDALTGLRNRRFLFEEVAKDISLVRRRHYEAAAGHDEPEALDLVFMMVDLDHFKAVNDRLGHAAGDQVLLAIRDILVDTCRRSDFIIRWGGDEFLVVARDTDPAKAEQLAERLRARIAAKAFRLGDGQQARTTCSIGYASFPFARQQPDALTWEQVMRLADGALYRAKQSRNCWIGYLSATETVSADALSWLVQEDPEELVRTGVLEVRRSAGPAEEGEEAGPAAMTA